jgi:hypothetical protein
MRNIGFFISSLLLGFLAEVRGAACSGDSASMRYLPRTIGRPNATIRTPYHMPCDTMEVKVGDTTTIYPGVMMHFGPVSHSENVILVGGVLQAFGSSEAPVYFSGTLADGDFVVKPGKGDWGGFRIEPVGQAHLQSARIFNAVPLLDSRSEWVVFEKVVTKNCLNVKGPDRKVIELEYKETRLDLDFRKKDMVETAIDSAAVPPNRPKEPSRGKALTWTLAGAGAFLAGGGLFYVLTHLDTNHPSDPDPDPSKFPGKPSFPTDGGP